MALLPRAAVLQHAGRHDGLPLRPGQHLLVGPIPSTLAVRIWLHRSTHDPLASHLSLLTGGTQLRPRPSAWTGRAAPTETSSAKGASDGPSRTCHLRLGHLQSVILIRAGPMHEPPAEHRADRPRIGA